MLASTLLSLAGFISLTTAGYVIEDDYEPSSFFGMFDFFTVRLDRSPGHPECSHTNPREEIQQA
jgi:hypothetical protein